MRKSLHLFLLVFYIALQADNLHSYSVLTHEAIVDTVWTTSVEPLLRKRFPQATSQDLTAAHAFAYGGSIIQDMGYYPFGSHYFSDLTHYVRSGDFVFAMVRESQDLNEYAFALGALAHYASDTTGHPAGINRAVPMLFPKLRRKYGDQVTYADDRSSHLKTEFGFDVVQVAKGRYPSDAYRNFIGFEVSKRVLEAAFLSTYGRKLEDISSSLDLALGTYRWMVSGLIPKMTKVAWELKKDEIAENLPGVTREKFLFNLSRTDYEKTWGTQYRKPGLGSRFLAMLMRIVPKIGPLRALQFRTPTPEVEKLLTDSFDATIERYRALLAAEGSRQLQPADVNLDVGERTTAGMYKLSDDVYGKLVDDWSKLDFAGIPVELRDDILKFYENQNTRASSRKDAKRLARLQLELKALRETAAISTPNK